MSARGATHDPYAAHGQGGRLATISRLYDLHGTALFRLALAICRDVETAGSAVVQAFEMSLVDPHDPEPHEPTIKHLARLTYVAAIGLDPTPSGPAQPDGREAAATPLAAWLDGLDMQRRALLALILHGDHTYTDAAILLHLDPAQAASTLRTMLREGVHVRRDGSRPL